MWTAPMPSTARVKSGSRRHSTTTRWRSSAQSSCVVLRAIAPPPTTIITGSSGSAMAGYSVPIGRIGVLDPGGVFDDPPTSPLCRRNRAGGDRHLAVAAGNVEDIGRLAQPGDTAAERTNEMLSSRDPGTEMCGAPGKIGMVKVVGLDPHRDKTPKQGLQHCGIVVDAAQQDGLRQEWDAGAAQPG